MNSFTALPADNAEKKFTLEETLELARRAIAYAHRHIKIGSTQISNNQLTPEEFTSRRKAIGEESLQDDSFGIRQAVNTVKNPLENDLDLAFFESVVMTSAKYSVGNCAEFAHFALDFVLRNADPAMIGELFYIINGDHKFLVLNREPGSEPEKPSTWGENAVICDVWANDAYQASDVMTKLNNYARVDGVNTLRKFNPARQVLTCDENFTTTYLRPLRTIENLKINFITKLTKLKDTLENYKLGLVTVSEDKSQSERDKAKQIFADRIKIIDVITVDIKRMIMTIDELNLSEPEIKDEILDEYRVAKSKLCRLYRKFQMETVAAMQFSSAEQQVLFLEENTKTPGLFGLFRNSQKSPLRRNLEEISDQANHSLLSLRTSNSSQ